MKQPAYFDYCATTPLHPDVVQAMLPVLENNFGNPSSMHWAGRKAAEIKDDSRSKVAGGLDCHPQEVIFTSGATEADNLALFGVLRTFSPQNGHLITCQTEHHAVLHAAQQVEKEGYSVTYLPVDQNGLISIEDLKNSIRPETRLISVMLVNNETGVIQPIQEICEIARTHNVLMHTDAVQGMYLDECEFEFLGVDMMSISAHKIYGPKGIGALIVREGTKLAPLLFGGPQENNLRAGTENMPGIAGLAAAVFHIQNSKIEIRNRLSELRKRIIDGLQTELPKVIINGGRENISPHVLSISFPGVSAEMLMLRLSMQGFAVSMGSACTSKEIVPSHVLMAMNIPIETIEGTLRISIGEPTTVEEVDRLLQATTEIVRDISEF